MANIQSSLTKRFIDSQPETTGNIVIRTAKSEDVDTIVQFNLELARSIGKNNLEESTLRSGVENVLRFGYGQYYLATEGNVVLAQVYVFREWNDWRNGWIWWIDNVFVISAARRRGVLTKLFKHLIGLGIGQETVRAIRLHVESSNHTAKKIYEGFGMRNHREMLHLDLPLIGNAD